MAPLAIYAYLPECQVSIPSSMRSACSWPRMDSYACLPLVAVSLISSMVCTEADLVSSKDDIRLTTGVSLTCLGTLVGSQERIRRASCACSWPQMCFMMITNYVCLSLAAHVTHRLGRNVPNQHEIYMFNICISARMPVFNSFVDEKRLLMAAHG